MATYYLHYGFDCNSYTIGSVWGSSLGGGGTISGTNYYWLQYALTTNSSASSTAPWAPALFNFQSGDTLQFVIWDLTQWTSPPPKIVVVAYLALNELDGTPFTSFSASSSLTKDQNDSYYVFPEIKFSYPVPESSSSVLPNSPVGSASGVSGVLGALTMTSDVAGGFIMNFCVEVVQEIDNDSPPPTTKYVTKLFVSEPEAYIGSGKAQ